jgi:hypothetical protein
MARPDGALRQACDEEADVPSCGENTLAKGEARPDQRKGIPFVWTVCGRFEAVLSV